MAKKTDGASAALVTVTVKSPTRINGKKVMPGKTADVTEELRDELAELDVIETEAAAAEAVPGEPDVNNGGGNGGDANQS